MQVVLDPNSDIDWDFNVEVKALKLIYTRAHYSDLPQVELVLWILYLTKDAQLGLEVVLAVKGERQHSLVVRALKKLFPIYKIRYLRELAMECIRLSTRRR